MAYSGSLVNTQIYYTLMQWNHMAAVDDYVDYELVYSMPDTRIGGSGSECSDDRSVVSLDLDVRMVLLPQFTEAMSTHRDSDECTEMQESYHIVAPFVELVRFLHP